MVFVKNHDPVAVSYVDLVTVVHCSPQKEAGHAAISVNSLRNFVGDPQT
jgi:hypothetical protein